MDKLFMKSILKISVVALLIIGFSACTKTKQDTPLAHLETKYQTTVSSEVKRIYIIDENVISCGNCLRHFHDYLVQKKPTAEELILLNNTGTFINRNFFTEKKCAIVQFKPKHQHGDSLLPNLGIVYLTNREIDSIVDINPANIQRILLEDAGR